MDLLAVGIFVLLGRCVLISSSELSQHVKKQAVLELLAQHQADALLEPEQLDIELGKRFKKFLPTIEKSAWYSRLIQTLDPRFRQATGIREILSYFPVLTRTEVQQAEEQMRVFLPGVSETGYGMLTTSGSTGKPVSIYRHKKTHKIQHDAAELLDVIWQERDLTKNTAFLKIALDNDQQPTLGEPYTFLGKTGWGYRRSLMTNTVPELLDFLVEKQIKHFLVNPMIIKFLIQEQLRNPRPKATFDQILSWADRVDPELRRQTKEVFGAKICDRYSSTEFGFLAIQCPKAEHLHALQFNNYIEIIDQFGNPCPIGVPGRVVVTSLQNLAMPLIRYELGDVAAFGEACQFGINLPVFEPLIVRTREAILLEDGRLEIPYIDGTDLAKHPEVVDLQAYRFQDGLVLLFQANSEIESAVIESSRSKLKDVFRTSNRVEILQVPSLGFLGFWKRKLVVDVAEAIPSELSVSYFEALAANKR